MGGYRPVRPIEATWARMDRGGKNVMSDADARRNRILAALPAADLHRLVDQMEPVDLDLGLVLHQPSASIGQV